LKKRPSTKLRLVHCNWGRERGCEEGEAGKVVRKGLGRKEKRIASSGMGKESEVQTGGEKENASLEGKRF